MKCRKCKKSALKIIENNETHERYTSENELTALETHISNQFGKWYVCWNCNFLFAKEDQPVDELGDIFSDIYSLLGEKKS